MSVANLSLLAAKWSSLAAINPSLPLDPVPLTGQKRPLTADPRPQLVLVLVVVVIVVQRRMTKLH